MTQYSIVIVAHKFLQYYSSGILIINSYNVILVVVIFLDVLCGIMGNFWKSPKHKQTNNIKLASTTRNVLSFWKQNKKEFTIDLEDNENCMVLISIWPLQRE